MQETPVQFLGWDPLEKGWTTHSKYSWASLVTQLVKNPPEMWDSKVMNSIPGSGGISAGEGSGNLLQYSCLEKRIDRGAWLAIVHGITKE